MHLDYDYPGFELFLPAAQNMLAFVKKTDPKPDLACALQSGYVVLGIGLSMVPEARPTFGARGAEAVDEKALASHLEAAIAAVPADGARSATALPWALILGQLLPLLLEWLMKRKP